MPRLEVKTAEGITLGLEVAGPGTRFTAALLDGLVLVAVMGTLSLLLRVARPFDPTGAADFLLLFELAAAVPLYVAYNVVLHWRGDGRTPGKRALGIRVLSADGQPASPFQIVLRGVIGVVDLLPLPLSIGLIAIAATEKHQRLGDLAAGTLVVREPRPAGQPLEPWARESWEDLQVRVLDLGPAAVERFGPADRDFLRAVITRRGLDPTVRRRLLEEVAAHYRSRLGRQEREDPRAVIKELYLFLRGAGRSPS